MNWLIKSFAQIPILKGDCDHHLIRASMVFIYLIFGIRSGLNTRRRD